MISDYDAELAVERELVLRLASVLWRLRRATGIETALFEFVTEGPRQNDARPSNVVGIADVSEHHPLLLPPTQEPDPRDREQLSSDLKRILPTASCAWRICRLGRPRSPQPLRTHAVAASPPDCVHAGVVAPPQATAEPLSLSIFVPAA